MGRAVLSVIPEDELGTPMTDEEPIPEFAVLVESPDGASCYVAHKVHLPEPVRNGVRFPRGFTAIRKYKHKEYKAIAEGGAWVREDTGQQFPTLNQLNASIADGNENVWNGNWKYRNDNGALRSINELRR